MLLLLLAVLVGDDDAARCCCLCWACLAAAAATLLLPLEEIGVLEVGGALDPPPMNSRLRERIRSRLERRTCRDGRGERRVGSRGRAMCKGMSNGNSIQQVPTQTVVERLYASIKRIMKVQPLH